MKVTAGIAEYAHAVLIGKNCKFFLSVQILIGLGMFMQISHA